MRRTQSSCTSRVAETRADIDRTSMCVVAMSCNDARTSHDIDRHRPDIYLTSIKGAAARIKCSIDVIQSIIDITSISKNNI